MRVILLDPYMFELYDETEINNNLSFFENVCYLLKNKDLYVYIFKDHVDRILNRRIKPFPIYLDQITNDNTKERIKSINSIFNSLLLSKFVPIDISICSGNQDYEVNSASQTVCNMLKFENLYIELCSVLIQKCFNFGVSLDSYICSGNKYKGLHVGDEFTLSCSCHLNSYSNTFNICSSDYYLNEYDKAFIYLIDMVNNGTIRYIECPEVLKGVHHNKIQTGSKLDTYSDLSPQNKPVIKLLRKFGLYRVIFKWFKPVHSKPYGSISVSDITEQSDCDIVSGWFYAETGFCIYVDLYFPKSVGKNLKIYLENDFSFNRIDRLIDSIF